MLLILGSVELTVVLSPEFPWDHPFIAGLILAPVTAIEMLLFIAVTSEDE